MFRGSKTSDDWAFGRGKQSYLRDDAAILASVKTKLQTFYSELFFEPNFGREWFTLLGQKDATPVVLAVKSAILESYGIVRVQDVQLTQHQDRSLSIKFVVDTINSTGASGGLTV